jgi:hypothetical protein
MPLLGARVRHSTRVSGHWNIRTVMEPGRVENIGANHKTCRRDMIQCGTIERSGTMGLWKQSRGKAIRPSKQALPTAANTTARSVTEKTRKDLIFSEKS